MSTIDHPPYYTPIIDHPPHYTQHGLECIDVLEVLNLPFHLANVIKYIWRHRERNGLEDLRKARWYLDRYISHCEKKEHQGEGDL